MNGPEAAKFEREHPLAHGGCGTYAIHEYGGTQLIVEIYVPAKNHISLIDIRQEVLTKNGLNRIYGTRIERLREKNLEKKLQVEVVDTSSRHDGYLTDKKAVIAMLDLNC